MTAAQREMARGIREWKSTAVEERGWAYFWADGSYVKTGVGKKKAALLLIGVGDGTKRFLALEAPYRESEQSWAAVLRQLKAPGVKSARLFTGDAAAGEVYPKATDSGFPAI